MAGSTPAPRVLVLHASTLAVHDETLKPMYSLDLAAPTLTSSIFDNVSRKFSTYTKACTPKHLATLGDHAYVLYHELWLQCFDISSGRQLWLKEIPGYRDSRDIAAAGDYVAAAFWGGVVVCHTSGSVARQVQPPGEYALCCALSSDGSKLAVAGGVDMFPTSEDDGIQVWSTDNWTVVARIASREFTTSVNCLAFVGPRPDLLLSGSNDSRFCLWNLPTRPAAETRQSPFFAGRLNDWVDVCTTSADGQRVLCGTVGRGGQSHIAEFTPKCPSPPRPGTDCITQLKSCKVAPVRCASFLGLRSCLLQSDPSQTPSDSLLLQDMRPDSDVPPVRYSLQEEAISAIAWQPPPASLAALLPVIQPPPSLTAPAAATDHAPGQRRVSWAASVRSPGCTRQTLHKAARSMSLPIPWKDPIRVVRLRHAGSVTMTHALDWDAIANVNEELRDCSHATATKRAKRRGD